MFMNKTWKKYLCIISVSVMCLNIAACGTDKDSEKATTFEESSIYVDDLVVGKWIAQGIIYEEQIVSFSENEALADLYDTNWFSFEEDGSYLYQNHVFTYEGEWIRVEVDGYENFYELNQKTITSYSIEGDSIESETKESKLRSIAYIVDGTDMLVVCEQENNESGTALIYIKEGGDDTPLTGGDTEQNYDKDNSTNSGDSYSTNKSGNSIATSEQRYALDTALNYLDTMAFSYSGLIEQLEFEGYSYDAAVYAVDNCGADWNEQAARKAQEYLDVMSFSYSELVEQLEFEGFTRSQAEYGANKVY